MSWVPIFEEITESSLWREPLHVRVAFVTISSKKNPKTHIARMDRFRLARVANITQEQADDAIQVLSSPDPNSFCKEHEGRRIIAVEGGWFVVSGKTYMERMKVEKDKLFHVERQADYEASKGGAVRHSFVEPSVAEVKLQSAKIGLPENEADKFLAYYQSNGWRVGRNKMVDWHKALSGWKLRMGDNYGKGSQQTGGGSTRRGFDRNSGTFNAGTTEDYDTAKIQAARELREQQRRASEDAGAGSGVRGES